MKTKLRIPKRILSLVLALVLVAGLMPISANAASTIEDATVKSNTYIGFTLFVTDWAFCETCEKLQVVESIEISNGQHSVYWNGSVNVNRLTLDVHYKFSSCGHEFTQTSNSITNFLDCKTCYLEQDGRPLSVGRASFKYIRVPSEHVYAEQKHDVKCIYCTQTNSECAYGEWKDENGMHSRTCIYDSTHIQSHVPSMTVVQCEQPTKCSQCDITGETVSHVYEYSAEGNTITEVCNLGCNHSETATLGYATGSGTYAYTGSEIKPLQVTYTDGWQGGTLDISYSVNITDVGTAMGIITVAETGVSATRSFTITKGAMSGISVNGYSGVYDGNAHSISVTHVPSDATVTYSTSENGTYTTTNPAYTEKGTYEVWYRIEDENYETVSGSASVVISTAKLTITADDKSKTYGEIDPELTYQITEGQLVGSDTLEDISISRADGEDADSYAITVSQTEGANPNYDITFVNSSFTIKQKEIGISWGTTEFLPYTGELIVPQADATDLLNDDVCTLTVSVVETTDGAGIIPGRWTAKVTALSNDNYCLPESGDLVSVKYGIVKGYIDAPVVSGIDETIKGKADGRISGLTTEMEYATEYTADDDKYTKVTDADMTFAVGTYYVRYQAEGYYNASPFTEITIKEGKMLTVTVPTTQTGYTITTKDSELVWNGNTTLTFVLADGYSKTDAFAVRVNGNKVELNANGQCVITNAQENITVTVEGVADITAPTAEITLGTNKWNTFLNNITFGLFFKNTQDVTITADDNGSGVNTIQYYLAGGELSETEVEQITEWEDYNGTFKIDPNNRYVVYVKITDNAGNTLYINSDGIVLDNIAPTLEGIENGKTYYGDLTVIKSDEQFYDIKTVTLDGEPMGFEEVTYGHIPADNAEHIVVVEDYAGNKTTYVVTVMKNYTVTYKADGVAVDTQSVGHGKDATAPEIPEKVGYTQTAPVWDKDGNNITADTEINAVYTINKYTVTYKADGEVVATVEVEHGKDATAPAIPEKIGYTQTAPIWDKDGKNITADTEINAVYTINKYTVTYKADDEVVATVEAEHGKNVAIPYIPAKAGYVGKWDRNNENITADTEISAVYTKLADVVPDDFKSEDKTELEDTKKQLEEMLKDDGYTEDDKKDIQDAIDEIDDVLEVIGNVENVEDLIDKIPDTVTKDDEAAIKAADDAYNTLTDEEKALVDPDAKKALDDAKAALAELNKPADPNSPQTGDNSNLWLWFALLFISGAGIFGITVYDRKRKATSKR